MGQEYRSHYEEIEQSEVGVLYLESKISSFHQALVIRNAQKTLRMTWEMLQEAINEKLKDNDHTFIEFLLPESAATILGQLFKSNSLARNYSVSKKGLITTLKVHLDHDFITYVRQFGLDQSK